MTTLIKIDGDYAEWIRNLSLRFRQGQIKAAIRVNSEMLRFYFSLGADIETRKLKVVGAMVSSKISVVTCRMNCLVSEGFLKLI